MAAETSDPKNDKAKDAATAALITMARTAGTAYRAVTGAAGRGAGQVKYTAAELVQPDNAPRVRKQKVTTTEAVPTTKPRAQRSEVARRTKAVRRDVKLWALASEARAQDSQDRGGATGLAKRAASSIRTRIAEHDAEAARRGMTPAELTAAQEAEAARAAARRVGEIEIATRPIRRRMIERDNARARPGGPRVAVVHDFRGVHTNFPVYVDGRPLPPRPVQLTGDALVKGLGDGAPSKFSVRADGQRTIDRPSGTETPTPLPIPGPYKTVLAQVPASVKGLDRSGRELVPPQVMPSHRAKGVVSPWAGQTVIPRAPHAHLAEDRAARQAAAARAFEARGTRLAARVRAAEHNTDRGVSAPVSNVPYRGQDGETRHVRTVVETPVHAHTVDHRTNAAAKGPAPNGTAVGDGAVAAARANEDRSLPDLKNVSAVVPEASAATKGLGKVGTGHNWTAPVVERHASAGSAASPWRGQIVVQHPQTVQAPRDPGVSRDRAQEKQV